MAKAASTIGQPSPAGMGIQLAGNLLPSGTRGTNGFQWTKTGASLATVNPIAGAVGAGVGFIADMALGAKAVQDENKSRIELGKQHFDMTHQSPYDLAGGYNQAMPGFRVGGKVMRYAMGGPVGAVTGHDLPVVKQPVRAVFTPERPATGRRLTSVRGTALANANGGPVDGYVSTYETTERAQSHANAVGGGGKIVPGKGGPRADDVMLQRPGADPVLVSSGEGLFSDDLLARMARSIGMGIGEYQRTLSPDAGTEEMVGRAAGGPGGESELRGYITNQLKSSSPGLDLWASPTMQSWLVPQYFNEMQKYGLAKSVSNNSPAYPIPGAGYDVPYEPAPLVFPLPSAAPAAAPAAQAAGAGAGPAAPPAKKLDDNANDNAQGIELGRLVDRLYGAQGAIQLGALGYNMFSKRTPGPRPLEIEPQLVDLQTGAMRNNMRTTLARSTGAQLKAVQGQQSQGMRLGLAANNLQGMLKIESDVQDRKNQETLHNNGLINNARAANAASTNAWMQSETAAQNQHRLMKGQMISEAGSNLIAIGGEYANANIMLNERDRRATVMERYQQLLRGGDETKEWDENYLFDYANGTYRSRRKKQGA